MSHEKSNKEIARVWVKVTLTPTSGIGDSTQPYTLKHILEEETGVYLTEDEFVSLLQEMGYKRKKTGSFRLMLPKYLKKRIKKGLVLG